MTIRILIDSSVWLDILKNARLDPVLTAIEDLVAVEAISLIMPEQIVFEFDRNKDRVKDARKTTLVGTVKRFREALSQIDSEAEREQALQAVSAIDHKLALTADTGEKVITRITELMAKAPVIAVTDSVKLKAADRSLTRAAPCHQTKNSIADAIILEAYLEAMAADGAPDSQFVFVTTNTNDFSAVPATSRCPTPTSNRTSPTRDPPTRPRSPT
ncbi:hypothetical protein EN883_34800 [Mesorhizobium sp. M7A.F.Ca.AU.002.06.1.1]|nr:PIN domain-containing protein [Mesorhizobium sp. M7A.F.Ca.AU.002.02.1.1]AMX97881.1 hypothetical protein A4R28_32340 [Mesorhizobium ciceri]RVB97285.1 hypothetical protein EN883_34800 [Mesorhizobium sp. M7A.F.Ca.AU.002.06.1.1]RVC26149.1 hypothetical protein EN879_03075 [Mesorhizobium sp. M7A.F.Ca.AU.002.02.1.1]